MRRILVSAFLAVLLLCGMLGLKNAVMQHSDGNSVLMATGSAPVPRPFAD